MRRAALNDLWIPWWHGALLLKIGEPLASEGALMVGGGAFILTLLLEEQCLESLLFFGCDVRLFLLPLCLCDEPCLVLRDRWAGAGLCGDFIDRML